jgi:histidyl-tRNA synthetase
MTESMRSQGMRDMLPADMERFRRIEKAFRDVCLGWGYSEVRTPTIEHLYLFTSAGTLSPQMLDGVYSFLDWDGWSGERVVLRPDSTIGAVRLYVEALDAQGNAKIFYVQNVFRFEQGDDTREDWQCGVELIGDTFPRGDLELVLIAGEVLERLGIATAIEISHPGIVRSVLNAAGLTQPEQLAVYDRLLEGDLSPLEDVQAKLPGSAAIGRLLATAGDGPEYLVNFETILGKDVPAITEPVRELRAVSAMLAEIGLAHRIAPLGVRNFEYYTGPVFSLLAGDKRVGGGGRYDALVGLVSGANLPASGFALEMEELDALLPPDSEHSAAITIRCERKESLARAFALARALRAGETMVQVVTAASGGGREIVVTDAGYELTLNGGSPKKLTDIPDVVRAVAGK